MLNQIWGFCEVRQVFIRNAILACLALALAWLIFSWQMAYCWQMKLSDRQTFVTIYSFIQLCCVWPSIRKLSFFLTPNLSIHPSTSPPCWVLCIHLLPAHQVFLCQPTDINSLACPACGGVMALLWVPLSNLGPHPISKGGLFSQKWMNEKNELWTTAHPEFCD